MTGTALFVGWGMTYPGREVIARKHYAEWIEILNELKATGEIETFETVLLTPHGGDLDGFTLVFGEPEQLVALQGREDIVRLQALAELDHARFGVIWAFVGEGVERRFTLFDDVITQYVPEPALV